MVFVNYWSMSEQNDSSLVAFITDYLSFLAMALVLSLSRPEPETFLLRLGVLLFRFASIYCIRSSYLGNVSVSPNIFVEL